MSEYSAAAAHTTEDKDTTFATQSQVRFNTTMDLGNLMFEDVESYADVTKEQFAKKTSANIATIYRALFDLKHKQEAKHGDEGQILEHDKPANCIEMPKSHTVLPREKPAPKEEMKTKWERFREERGLPPRKKRSRLVYDENSGDWVPRWGDGSIKKRAEANNWIMHEKPKHLEAGMNPFEYAKQEKKMALEKQKLATLKN